jgi:hypothetical protein
VGPLDGDGSSAGLECDRYRDRQRDRDRYAHRYADADGYRDRYADADRDGYADGYCNSERNADAHCVACGSLWRSSGGCYEPANAAERRAVWTG